MACDVAGGVACDVACDVAGGVACDVACDVVGGVACDVVGGLACDVADSVVCDVACNVVGGAMGGLLALLFTVRFCRCICLFLLILPVSLPRKCAWSVLPANARRGASSRCPPSPTSNAGSRRSAYSQVRTR